MSQGGMYSTVHHLLMRVLIFVTLTLPITRSSNSNSSGPVTAVRQTRNNAYLLYGH